MSASARPEPIRRHKAKKTEPGPAKHARHACASHCGRRFRTLQAARDHHRAEHEAKR